MSRFRLMAAAVILLIAATPFTSSAAVPPEDSTPDAAVVDTFRNPVNPSADPSVIFHEGTYYAATTRGDRISIWRSPSIATLLAAPAAVVWRDSDPSRNTQMWAPSFRQVGARWYTN